MIRWTCRVLLAGLLLCASLPSTAGDPVRDLQTEAAATRRSAVAHWGFDAGEYFGWSTHSLRLVPVYTFGTRESGPGIDLRSYQGEHSPYRSEAALREIYGYLPTNTLNPHAEYFDQTNLADLQRAALAAGKKHIFLVVFDGMDWQTTWAASLYATAEVRYRDGRGSGLHFQDYTAAGTTQFGYVVTAPHNDETDVDPDAQTVRNPGGKMRSGYNAEKAGPTPWSAGGDPKYIIGNVANQYGEHVWPDSANTATSLTAGIKSYNNAINVDPTGVPVETIAHAAQDQGYRVGLVTSVPITHATPAAGYAHNVSRYDYQDMARDLLGQPSVSHPQQPLPGVHVLIGGGYGLVEKDAASSRQGTNFVPGLEYISHETIAAADVRNGGPYTVVTRSPGVRGRQGLHDAASAAIERETRLLALYGIGEYEGHLPFRTADGDYHPAPGRKGTSESYTPADLFENPTLAEMTAEALRVLGAQGAPFWLMVEPGDVDWANHDNNLDNSIGAVLSGDEAVRTITDWVEAHSHWGESVLIVTADHGHYLQIDDPETLARAGRDGGTRRAAAAP